jgi:hypothetical protein
MATAGTPPGMRLGMPPATARRRRIRTLRRDETGRCGRVVTAEGRVSFGGALEGKLGHVRSGHAGVSGALDARPVYFERFAHVVPPARFRQPSSTLQLPDPRSEPARYPVPGTR